MPNTTIGNSTIAVTLTAKEQRVTLNGTIDAYGPAGTYSYAGTLTLLDAAVFGPATTDFTVSNTGTIIGGTLATDFGIILGAAGTVTNTGEIDSGSGILFAGKKSVLDNTGDITANAGTGAIFLNGGDATNSGVIAGLSAGILETGKTGLTLDNTGSILALGTTGYGIDLAAGYITNGKSGLISGAVIGILAASGTAAGATYIYNSGSIAGGAFGALLETRSGLYNYAGGKVTGTEGYGAILVGGAFAQNAGTISGGESGLLIETSGSVTNAKTGVILGQTGAGLIAYNGAVVYNYGSISGGTAAIGVYVVNAGVYNYKPGKISGTIAAAINGGGYLYNSGKLTGVQYGASIDGGVFVNTGAVTGAVGVTLGTDGTIAASLTNSGIIQGTTTGLSTDAAVSNTGLIEGTVNGAYLTTGATLQNAGTISAGATGNGLLADGTATAVNENTGLITGTIGADVFFGASLTNDGTIISTNALGIFVYQASASNAGLITGGAIGADVIFASLDNAGTINNGVLVEYGTLTDTGFITANASYAVDFLGSGNRLIIDPTATIHGNVSLAGATLEIAAGGKKITTINPTQYSDIGALTIDAKATLDIAGAYTASSFAIFNDGVIDQTNPLEIDGSLSGTGTVDLGAKDTLTLGGAVSGQTIAFTGTGETLLLGAAATFAGTLSAFALKDTIDLAGATSGTIEGFTAGILTIVETLGTAAPSTLTLTFASSIGNDEFVLTNLAGTGLALTLVKPAKAAILTPTATASPTAISDLSTVQTSAPAHAAAPAATLSPSTGWLAISHPASTPPVPAITLHA